MQQCTWKQLAARGIVMCGPKIWGAPNEINLAFQLIRKSMWHDDEHMMSLEVWRNALYKSRPREVLVSRLMASLGNCQEGDGILTDSHRFTQNSTAVTLFCTFVKQHRQAWKWKVTFLIGESWRINYKYTVAMFNDRLNCQRDPEGMTISSYTSEIGFTMCFLDRFLLW